MVEHKSLSKSLISKLFMHGVSIYSLLGKKNDAHIIARTKKLKKISIFQQISDKNFKSLPILNT